MKSKEKVNTRPSASPARTLAVRDPLLTMDETAETLGVTRRKVRRMIESKEIEYVKLNRLVRIRQSAIDAVIEASTVPAETGISPSAASTRSGTASRRPKGGRRSDAS